MRVMRGGEGCKGKHQSKLQRTKMATLSAARAWSASGDVESDGDVASGNGGGVGEPDGVGGAALADGLVVSDGEGCCSAAGYWTIPTNKNKGMDNLLLTAP